MDSKCIRVTQSNRSPVRKQRFIWYCLYDDGSMFTEFNDDGSENNYDDIKQDELVEFGILGNGGRIYFNTADGIVHLDRERTLKVYLITEDNIRINLTENSDIDYHSIVQYKKADMFFSMNGKQQTALTPTEHYIGYSGELLLPGNIIEFRFTYCLPAYGGNNFAVMRVQSNNKDFKGKIGLEVSNMRNMENEIDCPKGTMNEFKIVF